MRTKWLIKQVPDEIEISRLQNEFHLDEVIAYMLIQRRITQKDEINKFFRGTLQQLHDPFLMKDMDRAVDRVNKAIKNKEKILIYGDYDVDGTTAVSLMFGFLSNYANKLSYYIPDRYKEGYGVSEQGIHFAKEQGFSLIITLDCGIKANEMVDLANSLGIDMIICDHHNPGEELPNCIVLDPKRKDCHYPYKGLSGCGVGFKLLQALTNNNQWDEVELFQNLDLLAISIGADIVPVTGENRILSKFGLNQINTKGRIGITKLLNYAKKEKPLSLTDVVFTIAPRINAAGRLKDAKLAVNLLISQSESEATKLAKTIHELNEKRRELDKKTTAEALEILSNNESFLMKHSTIVYRKDWHKGVIGIVASRLIENYYRPTIVLTTEDNKIWTGSARSVNEVNIYEILKNCTDLLERFGGHSHAAGLSIKTENLAKFEERFEQEVFKFISGEALIPEQIIEKELPFNQLFQNAESTLEIPRVMRVLDQFEPYGPENMKPYFLAKNVYSKEVKLLKEIHLKMKVFQPEFKKYLDAIYFNCSDPHTLKKIVDEGPFDMIYTLERNVWKGQTRPQLMIKDIRQHYN